MGITAAVGVAATVASSAIQSGAAGDAANDQAKAAQNALNAQQGYFGIAQGNLQPFINAGQGATGQLQQLTGTNPGGNPLTAALTAQFQPTMAQLQATPGYQFTLGQGLKATQNSLAAQGLGGSGEALAGAANYATGLASNTYQQQFQNYLAGNQQTYNMLSGISNSGANAAGNLGSIGTQTGQGVANSDTQIGNAQAAGTLGSANALSNGLGGISQGVSQYQILSKLLGAQGGGLGAGSSAGFQGGAASTGFLGF